MNLSSRDNLEDSKLLSLKNLSSPSCLKIKRNVLFVSEIFTLELRFQDLRAIKIIFFILTAMINGFQRKILMTVRCVENQSIYLRLKNSPIWGFNLKFLHLKKLEPVMKERKQRKMLSLMICLEEEACRL